MIYSAGETNLIIRLREEGLVGQRLYNKFHKVYPDRSYSSVRSKIEVLREKGMMR